MKKKRTGTKKLIGLIAALIALGLVGNSDFEDAQKQEREYCSNVKAGNHPAYDKLIKCEEIK